MSSITYYHTHTYTHTHSSHTPMFPASTPLLSAPPCIVPVPSRYHNWTPLTSSYTILASHHLSMKMKDRRMTKSQGNTLTYIHTVHAYNDTYIHTYKHTYIHTYYVCTCLHSIPAMLSLAAPLLMLCLSRTTRSLMLNTKMTSSSGMQQFDC